MADAHKEPNGHYQGFYILMADGYGPRRLFDYPAWYPEGVLKFMDQGLAMVQGTFYNQIFMMAMTIGRTRNTEGGIPGFRFQDIRHCAATHMLLADVKERVIRAILGQKDPRMLDRYTHIVGTMLSEAALAVESLGFPKDLREEDVLPKAEE